MSPNKRDADFNPTVATNLVIAFLAIDRGLA